MYIPLYIVVHTADNGTGLQRPKVGNTRPQAGCGREQGLARRAAKHVLCVYVDRDNTFCCVYVAQRGGCYTVPLYIVPQQDVHSTQASRTMQAHVQWNNSAWHHDHALQWQQW